MSRSVKPPPRRPRRREVTEYDKLTTWIQQVDSHTARHGLWVKEVVDAFWNGDVRTYHDLIPCSCPLKKGIGLDFIIFKKNLIFYDFRKRYVSRKPLRDEIYGDGSATAETGRPGRFFLYY